VTDRRVRVALLDYLRSGRRLHVLREDQLPGFEIDFSSDSGADQEANDKAVI
jgi:hypothetical protein